MRISYIHLESEREQKWNWELLRMNNGINSKTTQHVAGCFERAGAAMTSFIDTRLIAWPLNAPIRQISWCDIDIVICTIIITPYCGEYLPLMQAPFHRCTVTVIRWRSKSFFIMDRRQVQWFSVTRLGSLTSPTGCFDCCCNEKSTADRLVLLFLLFALGKIVAE